jgi:hypothetical protein
MLTLPQDQGAWYLTVFGEAGDAEFQQLQEWLKTDEGLTKLKSQVRFNKYTTDQVRYQRYVETMPGLPCIRLQTEKGLVVSEFWGDNIPGTSNALYRGIKGDLKDKTSWGCLRRRRCPAPKPKPNPKPPVVVPDEKPVEPPVGPPVLDEEPDEPEESRMWILLTILGALGGGAFGFYQEYKAEHMDKASPPSKL